MARPRRISDDQILQAAREALLERGPNVSLQVIAERLGVTAAAVVKRVGSREALVARALSAGGPPAFLERLARGPERGPLRPQLEGILLEALRFFALVAPTLGVARAGGIPLPATGGEAAAVQVRRLLARYLEEAHQMGLSAPAHPIGASLALIGAVEAWGFHQWLGEGTWAAGEPEPYVRALLDGVWPPPPSSG